MEAHKDDKISWNRLTWLEKLNTICNREAKKLITNKIRSLIPFPFSLSSLYISSGDKVLNSKSQINDQILIKIATQYYETKLDGFPIHEVD